MHHLSCVHDSSSMRRARCAVDLQMACIDVCMLCALQSGKLSLKAVQSYQGEVQLAGTLLLKSLQQLAGCLDNSVMYKE